MNCKVQNESQLATASELAEYERLHAWRERWGALSKKLEPGRTCLRQERIERRASLCNLKIAQAMHAFDIRVVNTTCPIGEKGVAAYAFEYMITCHLK